MRPGIPSGTSLKSALIKYCESRWTVNGPTACLLGDFDAAPPFRGPSKIHYGVSSGPNRSIAVVVKTPFVMRSITRRVILLRKKSGEEAALEDAKGISMLLDRGCLEL